MIDKEAVKRRIAELEQERDNAVARVQAIVGALQDCQYWLSQLEEGED